MNVDHYFSASYGQARARFLQLCGDNGFELSSYHNDRSQAPDGGDLFMDVATIGPTDASSMLVVSSGTHGVEGYCGSGVQAALLGEACLAAASNELRIVLIHAVNPYGFSHDRRVNEDNIDLNRNFLEWGVEEPQDNGYKDIHAHLVPEQWNDEALEKANAALADYAQSNGFPALQQAASGGQYTHSDGIFYGGTQASWSNKVILQVIQELGVRASRATFIDIHTGLGPYGYGEMITSGSPRQVARSFDFFSEYEVTDPDAGTASATPTQGTIAHGIERTLPGVDTVYVALEFGTLPLNAVLAALRADNWLYNKGDVSSDLGQQIKQEIRDAFYCDESAWKEMIWARAREVITSAADKLTS